jgi:hypothetical protein
MTFTKHSRIKQTRDDRRGRSCCIKPFWRRLPFFDRADGDGSASALTPSPEAPLESKLRALLAQGQLKAAITEVEVALREDLLNPDLNEQLHVLYMAQDDPHQTLAHGQQWIKALVRAGRHREALAGVHTLHSIDEDFALDDGDSIPPIARLAMQDGAKDLAVGLVNGFDKRFPEHAELPTMYFLGARLLSEHWRQHDKAAQMVRGIIAHYAGHPVAAEAEAYLVALEAVIGSDKV